MPRDVLLGRDHLFIAEVAQAHDGNVATAHTLIDAAARAGVHAVKFQTHIASAESTSREPWRVKFSARDATRFDYWQRMEFSVKQWQELKAHCDEKGVEFMSSPFSPQAVELLLDLGIRIWKVASGEVSNGQLLDCMKASHLPIIFSSGLSTIAELRLAVNRVQRPVTDFAILQCATRYPTSADRIGLNVIAELQDEFGCVVGISDHSATVAAGLAAATLGARIFEVHIRLENDVSGPDASSSLVESQVAELVKGVAFVREALKNPVDKHSLSTDQEHLRRVFGRSLVASRSLNSGHVLESSDLEYKKPGGGLRYEDSQRLIGRRLRRSIAIDQAITEDDVEVDQ